MIKVEIVMCLYNLQSEDYNASSCQIIYIN